MSVRQKFFIESIIGVFLGFLIFVFVLAISNSHSKPLDLSKNARFTLSPQSAKVVKELAQPVKVYCLIPPGQGARTKAQDLMQRYMRENREKFSYELVDPDAQPGLAKYLDEKRPGPAVIEVPGKSKDDKPRRERALNVTEEDITNALMRLSRTSEARVYSLTGHGERDIDDTEKPGLSKFKSELAKEGFTLVKLNLAQDKKIPDDCKLLMIAGPTSELLPKEADMVKAYLKANGRVLLCLEHNTPDAYTKLINDYGMESPDQVIIDETAAMLGAEPVFSIGMSYDKASPITKEFKTNTAYQLARPVSVGKTVPNGSVVNSLVQTSPYAIAVATSEVFGKGGAVKIDASNKPKIALSVAAVGTYPNAETTPSPSPTPGAPPAKKPETRLVVFGDADFLANLMLLQLGNRDLAMNTVNWLAETENQISIRPVDAESTPLRLTETEMNQQMFFNCILLPITLGGLGLFLSWRRR